MVSFILMERRDFLESSFFEESIIPFENIKHPATRLHQLSFVTPQIIDILPSKLLQYSEMGEGKRPIRIASISGAAGDRGHEMALAA